MTTPENQRATRQRRPGRVSVAFVVLAVVLGAACSAQVSTGGQASSDAANVESSVPGATSGDSAPVASDVPRASAGVVADLGAVPLEAIVAAAHSGESVNPLQPQPSGNPLTSDGKPEVLYIGAEFCPYCAGERWPLVIALSKFGTFSGLGTIESSESSVPTLTFLGSTYTSRYVAFTPIEMQGQKHENLMPLSASQRKLFESVGRGSFPFIDFGGASVQVGGSVDLAGLVGKSQEAIAAQLAASKPDDDPASLTRNVNRVAGGFIAAICGLTKNQPTDVCGRIPVR